MKPEVLEALNDSIAHWERMRDGTQRKAEVTGIIDCALCNMFFYSKGCIGCPVEKNTKSIRCFGSPYQAAADCEKGDLKWHELYNAEVQFLRSLLP